MVISELTKKLKKLIIRVKIKIRQKNYNGLPYLYQKNDSNNLLIVFSAFTGHQRRYNYVTSFNELKCDKLFILDPWGYLGSYNMYENGEDYPSRITQSLINNVITGKQYEKIYTAGTSKGGTAAIFFGLDIGADDIFSGACQYNLGTYLWRKEFREIFYGMMGKEAGEKEVELLNHSLRDKLRKNNGTRSTIHVFYSRKELTYERQIIDLLHDLKEFEIPFRDVEADFDKHEDVAKPFVDYVISFFNRYKNE